MRDDLKSAYAALGLEPGAPLPIVKRQFKTLVRTWHPDRFVGDPQGVAEANQRLRIINRAYNTILATFNHAPPQLRRDPPTAAPAPSPSGSAQGGPRHPPVSIRLTPEQIDAIVESLKAHGRRTSLSEQIRIEPWNRGLSLAVAIAYVCESAWATWQNPWPALTMLRVTPTLPATGPIMASMVMSAFLVWPMLYAIWYSDRRTKIAGWIFLAFVALVIPAMRRS